jgi:hypothetical protein
MPAVAMMKIPAATKIGRSRLKARHPSFAPDGKIGRNDGGVAGDANAERSRLLGHI